jgi:hypothetical protein
MACGWMILSIVAIARVVKHSGMNLLVMKGKNLKSLVSSSGYWGLREWNGTTSAARALDAKPLFGAGLHLWLLRS